MIETINVRAIEKYDSKRIGDDSGDEIVVILGMWSCDFIDREKLFEGVEVNLAVESEGSACEHEKGWFWRKVRLV